MYHSHRWRLGVLFLFACQHSTERGFDESESPDRPDARSDAGDDGGTQGGGWVDTKYEPPETVAALVDRPLFELTSDEARTVCLEGWGLVDPCLSQAVGERTPQRCEEAANRCRALSTPDEGGICAVWMQPLEGKLFTLYDRERCVGTAGQYLACQHATGQALRCELARGESFQVARASDACLAFAQACPYLPKYEVLDKPVERAPLPTPAVTCDPSTSPARVDQDDDIVGADGCRPLPSRLVVLGDSVATCLGSTLQEACAPELLAAYLQREYAPDLRLESYALNGARTVDALMQARKVQPAAGHLLIWANFAGNDLTACQLPDIDKARACVDGLLVTASERWRELFAHFEDRARFPDGVTFVLNTQYSPFDQCHHPLMRGPFTEEQIQRFNEHVLLAAARERDHVVALDQYPDWLGHGRNANDGTCPHCYQGDNTRWLGQDGFHPNGAGQEHIAAKGYVLFDRMYGGACAE